MSPDAFTTCAYCPRLCRHVCPVSTATGFESATPTAMMTVGLLHVRGELGDAETRSGTSLCLGCGACTAHCKVHVPVADTLATLRATLDTPEPPTRLLASAASAPPPPVGRTADPAPATRSSDPSPDRERPTAPPEVIDFVTCWQGPWTSPDQLACCGRRDGFAEREPEAARAIAEENVRRFAGRAIRCADAACAAFLRAHGARPEPAR